jgi:hypothetical protein
MRDIADSTIIKSFARTVSGNVSAGENAVALVKASNKLVRRHKPAGRRCASIEKPIPESKDHDVRDPARLRLSTA